MAQNIFVGVLCVIALAAGIWVLWVDNGVSFGKDNKKDTKKSEENNDEKN